MALTKWLNINTYYTLNVIAVPNLDEEKFIEWNCVNTKVVNAYLINIWYTCT